MIGAVRYLLGFVEAMMMVSAGYVFAGDHYWWAFALFVFSGVPKGLGNALLVSR